MTRHNLGFVLLVGLIAQTAQARPCAQLACRTFGANSFPGSITEAAPLQTGRVLRNGVDSGSTCLSLGPDAALTVPGSTFRYASLPLGSFLPGCVTVQLVPGPACNIYAATYDTTFDPAHPEVGVIGQLGASFPGASYSFQAVPGETYPTVVSTTVTNTTCAGYTLNVTWTESCRTAGFDASGDRFADRTVFRPSTGTWYVDNSAGGTLVTNFGLSGDLVTAADYNNNARTDVSVYRPSSSVWYALADGVFSAIQWGLGGDIPVPVSFDRDGIADINIFRPSSGTWYTRLSSTGGLVAYPFGLLGDRPLAGDFDGDLRSDYAVARPVATALDWYVQGSNFGQVTTQQFGLSTDIAVPADYDGDGKSDIAVWRPSTGTWYYIASITGAIRTFPFGSNGDVPQPSDIDGDGRADFVVYRQSATPGQTRWYARLSSTGSVVVSAWGALGDVPATAQNRVP